MRIGDGLDTRVRSRGDDEEGGSELGRELGDLTQISQGSVSNVLVGVGEVTFGGEVRAHGTDREPSVFGELLYPLRVMRLRGSPSASMASYPRRARRSMDVATSSPWKPMTLYE
jgi:hypothetical protein